MNYIQITTESNIRVEPTQWATIKKAITETIQFASENKLECVTLVVRGVALRINPTSSVEEKVKVYAMAKHTGVTRFLEQQEENKGLAVNLQVSNESSILCNFMWFEDDITIDLMPVGGCQIVSVKAHNWNKISLL